MSQTDLILNHLRTIGGLTPLTALKRYGIMRIAARIGELRDRGYDIKTDMVKRQKKRFASYVLVAG